MISRGKKRATESQESTRLGLKMKDLVDATGAPKATILHYLREGLLPAPVKTSTNMAYYDRRSVARIRLIRQLQRHHRLKISEIRRVLAESVDEEELSMRASLNELIFGPLQTEGDLDLPAFCEATGLSREQVQQFVCAKLLLPAQEGRFDQTDAVMGRMYVNGMAAGLQLEDMVYYVELGEKIVDHEMALRGRLTRHLPSVQNASLTMQLVKAARMTRAYIIDRLFQRRVSAMRDLRDGETE
jgi:DNA-binding transcriptional MerR regulator